MEKVEVIADFLCNGLEHSSIEEAAAYLSEEVGMDIRSANLLVSEYLAKYSAIPVVQNSELFPFCYLLKSVTPAKPVSLTFS
jgi:hypothetical protein